MPLLKIERRFFSNFDWQLGMLMLLVIAGGMLTLYSAGFVVEGGTSPAMKRQMVSFGIGMTAFFGAALLSPNFWRRSALPIYGICCVMLLAILLGGVVAGGARRWLEIGGFRMQPAEFSKFGLILALSYLFSSDSAPRDGYRFSNLFLPLALLGLPVLLILKEPDLGTALCHILIAGSMLLLMGVNRGTLMRLALIGAISIYPAWHMLKDYQRQRVVSFISPEQDPLGSGYHAIQSKIAVGSGALMGKGFLKGTQSQLSFLPEQTTDFIFSVFAEEWGFLGSGLVLAIYFFLILRILHVAERSPDRFSAFVCFGVASLVFWQVFMNIGMVTGVLPVVGITLPLFSFGGSSMVTVMAGLGLVTGISFRRFLFG